MVCLLFNNSQTEVASSLKLFYCCTIDSTLNVAGTFEDMKPLALSHKVRVLVAMGDECNVGVYMYVFS